MREFLETHYNVRVIRWDEPTDFGVEFEVIHNGRVIRADSAALILAAVQDRTHRPLHLAWTNVFAGPNVLPMWAAA